MSREITELLGGLGGIVFWIVVVGVSILLATVVFYGLEKLESSKFGTLPKIPLCLILVVFGLFPLSGFVTVFFREASPATINFMKILVEGPWMCYVFFRVIKSAACVAVIPFLALFFAWQGYIIYLGFSADQRFGTIDGIGSILSVCLTVLAYGYFKKEFGVINPEQDSTKSSFQTGR